MLGESSIDNPIVLVIMVFLGIRQRVKFFAFFTSNINVDHDSSKRIKIMLSASGHISWSPSSLDSGLHRYNL